MIIGPITNSFPLIMNDRFTKKLLKLRKNNDFIKILRITNVMEFTVSLKFVKTFMIQSVEITFFFFPLLI